MLRVIKKDGEPTVFFVESRSLECTVCNRLYDRRERSDLHVGSPCERCAKAAVRKAAERGNWVEYREMLNRHDAPKIDLRYHRVDIASYGAVGQCVCEYFIYTLEPKLCRMPERDQRESGDKYRCQHIKSARSYALELALHLHETERHKDARGQREENQP